MKKKNAFTMIEILMIAIVMWTALLWVLSIMKKMEQSNIKIAENVIATNLAIQWYELLRAQVDDVRYDNLLSGDNANDEVLSGKEVQWLWEWIYYVVYAEQKTWLTYSWDIITGWLNNTSWDGYKQLRVILWAVCTGNGMKLSNTWLCYTWSTTWELQVYPEVTQWSGICLYGSGRLPCTWWWQFFREIVVSEDIVPDWDSNYRYWYNVCSKVTYNWQAGWQARKEQVAEICAKIN